jgi:hypothetical protein
MRRAPFRFLFQLSEGGSQLKGMRLYAKSKARGHLVFPCIGDLVSVFQERERSKVVVDEMKDWWCLLDDFNTQKDRIRERELLKRKMRKVIKKQERGKRRAIQNFQSKELSDLKTIQKLDRPSHSSSHETESQVNGKSIEVVPEASLSYRM